MQGIKGIRKSKIKSYYEYNYTKESELDEYLKELVKPFARIYLHDIIFLVSAGPVAQRQSARLITAWSQVRIPPGPLILLNVNL
jgi:hypothetical protein